MTEHISHQSVQMPSSEISISTNPEDLRTKYLELAGQSLLTVRALGDKLQPEARSQYLRLGDSLAGVAESLERTISILELPVNLANFSPALALSHTRRALQHLVSSPEAAGIFPENPDSTELQMSALTNRERQILAKLTRGLSNGQIAKELWLGEATVKLHCSNIYSKLGVRNRTEAMIVAAKAGGIDGEADVQTDDAILKKDIARKAYASLTPTERIVAELVSAGRTNNEISEITGRSEDTVKFHVHRMFVKLGVTNRTELAIVFLDNNAGVVLAEQAHDRLKAAMATLERLGGIAVKTDIARNGPSSKLMAQ